MYSLVLEAFYTGNTFQQYLLERAEDARHSDKLSISTDTSLKPEELLEVMSTEDERIKIIGEELANDIGRAIFTKITAETLSASDLSKSLGVSLPLVNWHVNRLIKVGLVKVERVGQSSKNKEMKYYGPAKSGIVIISAKHSETSKLFEILRSLNRLSDRLVGFVAFVSGTVAILFTGGLFGNGTEIILSDPSVNVPALGEILLNAILGGAAVGISAVLLRRVLRKKKESEKERRQASL